MKTEDKERIDRESSRYAQGFSTNGFRLRMAGYVSGAVAEHEHMAEQLKQERNKAIDVQKILTNSEGSNHLKWIYDRMIYVLGENPNMDYMHKFKSIIEKLTAHGEH